MNNFRCWCFFMVSLAVHQVTSECTIPSSTTVTRFGKVVPPDSYCIGDLIFEDNFDDFSLKTWSHNLKLNPTEFQFYVNNRNNTYARDGILHLNPTLPTEEDSLKLIRSARIQTNGSFAFKYGLVEISARIPTGDWLFPALWLMPEENKYGGWPRSGEIDMMEARGNENLVEDGVNIGTEQVGTTLHFGPTGSLDAYETAHELHNTATGRGWNQGFHKYGMEWTANGIAFLIDGVVKHTILAGAGFWDRGDFAHKAPDMQNIWQNGTAMTPFDEEYHLIIDLNVGGTGGYFPDEATNPGGKPWKNWTPTAAEDFWNGRDQWIPTWNMSAENHHFQVDYIRVWAV